MPSPINGAAAAPPAPTDRPDLKKAAQELEAVFLSEMLKSAGLGRSQSEFGGGIGEDQFSGFLVAEQARAFAEKGGIGLAEAIYESLLSTSQARE